MLINPNSEHSCSFSSEQGELSRRNTMVIILLACCLCTLTPCPAYHVIVSVLLNLSSSGPSRLKSYMSKVKTQS